MAWENFSLNSFSGQQKRGLQSRYPHRFVKILLGKRLVALGFECISHGEGYESLSEQIQGPIYV